MTDASEEWRPIPAHPDYEVSNLGRIRSYKTTGRDRRRRNTPRMMSPHHDAAGYVRTMCDGTHRYLHWAVAAAWHGPCPEGMEVDHINNVRDDNRPDNLRYLTRQENLVGRNIRSSDTCAYGHQLSGENLYVRPGGRRDCRACASRRSKNRPVHNRPCSIEACERLAQCRLLTDDPVCEAHYQRQRKAAKQEAS